MYNVPYNDCRVLISDSFMCTNSNQLLKISVPEGSQIVIVSQDSSELGSLQDMTSHPIVIYNEVSLLTFLISNLVWQILTLL